jgi:hypothetical protein
MRKQATLRRKDPPTAVRPISVTASFPSRLPKMPFTAAPTSGNSTMNASSVRSF